MDTRDWDAYPSSLRHARVGLRFALVAAVLLAPSAPRLVAQPVDRDRLRAAIDGAGDPIGSFYAAGDFTPVWVGADGAWRARADSALAVLRGASTHGLDPGDYPLAALEALATRIRGGHAGEGDHVAAEVLLTDALLQFGSHLLRGRADPSHLEDEWLAQRRAGSVTAPLVEAVDRNRIRDFAEAVAPPHPEYSRLRNALAELGASERWGGWGTVGDGPTLRAGDTHAGVDAVRRRLRLSSDSLERSLAAKGAGSSVFDPALEQAVRRFQGRHGLDPDGVVGRRTRAAMNVGVVDRIEQIRINLERWRWLPADLGPRHVRVNIPAFEAQVFDDTLSLRTRVVVGRTDRTTPSFNSAIEYLVLAPYWHVPPTIAAMDKLPLIRDDPSYLAASRMTLFAAATGAAIDASTVDWSSVTGAEFNRRFRLRQDPGPSNALGSVKFVFPNRHSVGLHDTPQKSLFSRTVRALSSGCVRVADALGVAELLLSDQPEWTRARIREVVARGEERVVNLSRPVPVYLLYFTAFVDPDGTLHLRPDIYGRDDRVLSALDPP